MRRGAPADPIIIRQAHEVPGQHYRTPKELWGFRLPPATDSPADVARRTLSANATRLGLDGLLESVTVRRAIPSLGGWHVVLSQTHLGHFVHRAYATVHMDHDKAVYLVKNRVVPLALLPGQATDMIGVRRATQLARRALGRQADAAAVVVRNQVWFPDRSIVRFAHKFHFVRHRPAGDWLVYIDAETGDVLWKYDNLAQAPCRARIFDPNPVVALGGWTSLIVRDKPVRRVPADAYAVVPLRGLGSTGFLDGPRVTTRATPRRIRRPSGDFCCFCHQAGFEEVMAYCHIDRAIRYVESLGYRGRRSIFRAPLEVNARAGGDDESWYMSGTRTLGFGVGAVDDAEDADVIVHEFGHALQDAICPDFGQSPQSAAMGEGFGDYLAGSVFAEQKNGALLPCVMTWDGILCADDAKSDRPPCLRRLDSDLTFESFDHTATADEHLNGQIWSATLWEIWQRVGKAVADRIIIESHFQLDAHTSFAKGARGILDADRNLFDGTHVATLKRVFRRRGIGPVD
jgi:hypothetical protein